MESAAIAVKVVSPLFLLMAAGYVIRLVKAVPPDAFLHMNNLCFKFFLPALLFNNIVSADIRSAFNARVMGYTTAAQFVSMCITLMIVPRLIKEKPVAASCAQAVFRSNFVAVGIALISDIVDADGLALVSLLGASTVPMFNFCAVIILESLRGGKISLKSFAKNVITNPLIIASALGVIFLLLGIKPAGILKKSLNDAGSAATPLAIVCLGGLFNFASVKQNIKPVIIGSVGRLVVIPGIAIAGAVLAGFRGGNFLSIAAVFMPPVAVASFSMAKQMGADGDTAALLIVTTSIFSLITMAFWLALTHYYQLW
ncbi:MAG: AEC family transporter [Treponemataceae bacterium]|nr:MAG: AEC family transporter [Treponemataceae bacterium]